MATVRFHREYTHRLDKDRTRTWPLGWSGEIGDAKIAHAAVKACAGVFVGGAPELPAELEAETDVETKKRGGAAKLV